MSNRKELVIVGGGTAGWLTALAMLKSEPNNNITLIESEDIGILGAGEGTTPFFFDFLKFIDLTYSELVANCKATVKMGINFENWLGDKTSYFHGFSSDNNLMLNSDDFISLLNDGISYDSVNFGRDISFAQKTCFTFSDVKNTTNEPMRSFNQHSICSTHFDARLLASYLKKVALKRGCKYIEGKVSNIEQDEKGNIISLSLGSEKNIKCDFVFDCTGFARLILGKKLGAKWKSYSQYLGLDTAIPFFQPHDGNFEAMTTARAMDNGWVWRIPVEDRWGCGYVFSGNHITPDKALEEVRKIYGKDVESPREFKFSAGIFEETVKNNCLAIGLSQGFVEPLEATSIWIALMTIDDFVKNKIMFSDENAYARFNERYNDRQFQVLEFLRLHYITPRRDTKFWNTVANEWYVPDELIHNINELVRWPFAHVRYYGHAIFNNLSWLQVLNGLQFYGKTKYVKETFKLKERELVLEKSISNKDFINYIKEHYELSNNT
jgi:tryptophan halogenase